MAVTANKPGEWCYELAQLYMGALLPRLCLTRYGDLFFFLEHHMLVLNRCHTQFSHTDRTRHLYPFT